MFSVALSVALGSVATAYNAWPLASIPLYGARTFLDTDQRYRDCLANFPGALYGSCPAGRAKLAGIVVIGRAFVITAGAGDAQQGEGLPQTGR